MIIKIITMYNINNPIKYKKHRINFSDMINIIYVDLTIFARFELSGRNLLWRNNDTIAHIDIASVCTSQRADCLQPEINKI